ncbi:efflux RND transporter periplasmic adaptor subunit [Arvimicrobium flavum]|uniref:efflux RND transporter periplasmic adaptor subunit n=1 Tax=Arvimicrobium flavum TaxID=3393320 RepID=UPI00237A278A|nr:efflux RND transporter periplasmic adaptor subunit [Mesorhizobium shangrilense]
MPKFRFHKLAALAVLIAFAAWMGTGKFSSVGSASAENEAKPAEQAAEQAKAAPRTVAVITPPRVQHARAIRLSGQTEADKRAVLATRAAGIIEELPVVQGDHVKSGDLVLMLSAEDKPAMVDMSKQVVKQREAELEASQKLAKTGNLPKLQLDTAISALAQAKSQLEQAQAELERNRIVAPFNGVVDKVSVERGSSVMQGGEVATLISLDPVLVKGEISERDLRHIKSGDNAEALLVNGETVKGKVRYISREASPATRTFRIEVAIPNPDLRIPAGMTAEITLRAAPEDAVVLPRSVVTLSSHGDLGIRAADKDNKVVFFPIDLVDDTSSGLVLGGIPADARIIVAGQDLVQEGDEVNPVQANAELVKKLAGEPAGTN